MIKEKMRDEPSQGGSKARCISLADGVAYVMEDTHS